MDQQRVAVLEQALAATADATDSPIRAQLLATLGLELTWSSQRRRLELSGDARKLARRLGDPATLAQVLLARFYACAAPDTRAERLATTTELLALADQLGDAAARSRALALRFRVAMESADVAEADRCLEANQRPAVDLGQPTLRWFVGLQGAGRSLLAGQLEEAERLAQGALELGQSSGQPEALSFFVWQLAVIRFEQGAWKRCLTRSCRWPPITRASRPPRACSHWRIPNWTAPARPERSMRNSPPPTSRACPWTPFGCDV